MLKTEEDRHEEPSDNHPQRFVITAGKGADGISPLLDDDRQYLTMRCGNPREIPLDTANAWGYNAVCFSNLPAAQLTRTRVIGGICRLH